MTHPLSRLFMTVRRPQRDPRRPRARLRLEQLDERIVPSWSGVPPTQIPIPPRPIWVTLDSQGDASGDAAISNIEEDYYSFVAKQSGSYRIEATTPNSNLDTVLGVFDSTGRLLAFNDDIDWPNNRDSRVILNLTAGQRYYVGITNYIGTPGGTYRWSIDGPADIVAPAAPPPSPRLPDDRFETGSTIATAYDFGASENRTWLNSLVLADAADWYRFTLTGAGTSASYVSIRFQHSQGDLDLRLYDANGTLVRVSDGIGNEERVSLNGLAAGVYYVQVYGYRGATNRDYLLDINRNPAPAPIQGHRILYVNFDGANISRSDLVRWAGSDWANMVDHFDPDRNGVTVSRWLGNRSDREIIIARILQLLQEDLAPFGIQVRRHTGLAVENQMATTVFVGRSTLGNGLVHVASQVDIGNNNRTDIAFVGEEGYFGSTEATALLAADVILHEAGHTWGLWHVSSGSNPETMGIRYSTPQSQWITNTRFTNQTYAAFVSNGIAHGPGPLNPYQAMMQTFGSTSGGSATVSFSAPAANTVTLVDTSRPGLFIITGSAQQDTVTVSRQGSAYAISINGRLFIVTGLTEVRLQTQGDSRDTLRAVGDLGALRLTISQSSAADATFGDKVPRTDTTFWRGNQVFNGCNCSLCSGAVMREFVPAVSLDVVDTPTTIALPLTHTSAADPTPITLASELPSTSSDTAEDDNPFANVAAPVVVTDSPLTALIAFSFSDDDDGLTADDGIAFASRLQGRAATPTPATEATTTEDDPWAFLAEPISVL